MYNLIAIDSPAAPEGMDGQNWCRYIIARDGSTIVAYHRGTLQQVTQHARDYVDELNSLAKGHVKSHHYALDASDLRATGDRSRSRNAWRKAVYKVVSVDRTTVPEEIDGQNYCRYIIAWDASTIVGYRRGTAQQVTQHARHYVDELNARAEGRVNPYRLRRPQQRPQTTAKK